MAPLLRARPARVALLALALGLGLAPPAGPARANHGPGASGGGSATISGETLKAGAFEFSLRQDYAQFEAFNTAQSVRRAQRGGDFDTLNHGFITSVDAAYGLTRDFQIGASVGYFIGRDFKGASVVDSGPEAGSVEVAKANPSGLTDLVLSGKYRLFKGQPGNLSLIAGVKLPTGRSDVHLSNGNRLSPTDQPGTGAWDFPVGLAYSRFLTPRLTLDASALYTIRTQRAGFRVGDRLDVGMALAYRLTDSIKRFPQYSVFAEVNDIYLQKDTSHGQRDPNSGSNTVYLTPGARVRFDKNWSLTVAPSLPVYQDLNGDQGRVSLKLAITLSFAP